MFTLEATGQREITMYTKLPEGKTQAELIELSKEQLLEADHVLYGNHVKINGRITTAMAMYLGHRLAHICKEVSIFDPKENAYVVCVKH